MEISALYARLSDHCNNGVLTLDTTSLSGLDKLTNIIQLATGEKLLKVSNCVLSQSDNVISITQGGCTLWNKIDFTVQGHFYLKHSSIEMALCLTPRSAVNLTQCFPSLSEKIPTVPNHQPSFLADFHFDKPQFIICSTVGTQFDKDLNVGNNFFGSVKLGTPYSDILDWFELNTSYLDFSGRLGFDSQMNEGVMPYHFDFSASLLANPKKIGDIQVESLDLVLSLIGYEDQSGNISFDDIISIDSQIMIGQTLTDFIVSFQVGQESGIHFQAIFETHIPSIADISSFFKSDFQKLIPKELDHLELTGIGFSVDSRMGLTMISCDIMNTVPWPITDKVMLENMTLFAAVHFTPIKSLSTIIASDVGIGKIVCHLSLEYPSKNFSATMVSGLDYFDSIVKGLWKQIPDIPHVEVSELTLSSQGDAGTSFSIATNENWSLALGHNNLTIEQVNCQLTIGSSTSGSVSGSFEIDGNEFTVAWTLPDDLSLSGSFPSIEITKILTKFCSENVNFIPTYFPVITLCDAAFDIEKSGTELSMTVSCTVKEWGKIFVQVYNHDSTWAFAAGCLLAKWSFASIDKSLSELDSLHLPEMYLIFSNIDNNSLHLQGSEITEVTKGVNLSAQLSLKDHGLDFLAKMLNIDHAQAEVAFGSDITKVALYASFDIKNPKVGAFSLSELSLGIQPDPLAITFISTGHLQLNNGKLLKFSESVSIGEGTEAICLSLINQWADPMGIKGLTFKSVQIELSDGDAGFELSILAKLKTKEDITLGGTLTDDILTALVFEDKGVIQFGEVVDMIAGLDIDPSIIDISISDLDIYMVSIPTEVFPNPGFHLSGTLNFFGFNAYGSFTANLTRGISGFATMSYININKGLLVISSATEPKKGPSITVDTQAKDGTYLSIDTKVQVLDQSISDVLEVTKKGFSFRISEKSPDFSFGITATYLNGELSSSGSCDFIIDHTFSLPANLGKVKIKDQLKGTITLDIGVNKFEFILKEGRLGSRSVPTLKVLLPFNKFEHMVSHMITHLEKEVSHVFRDLYSDADHWLSMIETGIVSDLSCQDVAEGLHNHFPRKPNVLQETAFIISSLKKLGWCSTEEIAKIIKMIFK